MINRKTIRCGLGLMVLSCLAACSLTPQPQDFSDNTRPRITVTAVPISLDVPLPGREGEFPARERQKAARFLDSYRDGGRGPLKAVVTARDLPSAEQAAKALRLLATRRGVVEDALEITLAAMPKAGVGQAVIGPRPGIALHYTDFVAVAPPCNPEIGLGNNPDGAVSPNLGCFLERNMAAMIAHPAELLSPAEETAHDGARIGRAYTLYRLGKATEAEVNRNDDAKIVGLGGK
ncbi:MAG: CpaD family pilus assembly lipoprotein [Rhodospirillaceae bacterium]